MIKLTLTLSESGRAGTRYCDRTILFDSMRDMSSKERATILGQEFEMLMHRLNSGLVKIAPNEEKVQ